MRHSFHWAALAMSSALVLPLCACNKAADKSADSSAATSNSALPTLPQAVAMQSGPATAIAPAPNVAQLHASRPIAVARPSDSSAAYAYLDRADGVSDAIGDAPPDYSYDDDGVRPWAWQTHDGDVQYAEPVDVGYRYYYYEPGDNEPYLVRDRDYSYAFASGALVAIYAANGALVPPYAYSVRRDYASRYYWRARELRQRAAQQHEGVVAADWAARRPEINAAHADWAQSRAQQPDWQNYHDQHAGQEQAHWQAERQQRQAETDRFSYWQAQGLQGQPPQPASNTTIAAEPNADRRNPPMARTPVAPHAEPAPIARPDQPAKSFPQGRPLNPAQQGAAPIPQPANGPASALEHRHAQHAMPVAQRPAAQPAPSPPAIPASQPGFAAHHDHRDQVPPHVPATAPVGQSHIAAQPNAGPPVRPAQPMLPHNQGLPAPSRMQNPPQIPTMPRPAPVVHHQSDAPPADHMQPAAMPMHAPVTPHIQPVQPPPMMHAPQAAIHAMPHPPMPHPPPAAMPAPHPAPAEDKHP